MKCLLLLLVLFLTSNYAYCQEAKELQFDKQIAYSYKYIIDTNNKADIKEEIMMLLLNDSLSLFESQKRLQSDSSAYEEYKKGAKWVFSVIMVHTGVVSSNNYQIFKSRNGIRTFDAVNGKGVTGNNVIHQYDEKPEDFDWEILPDTMRIASYLCQKAKVDYGGRIWYAWFSPEIPRSDGPYTFSGLPGLIFQVHDEDNYFQFDLMQIQNINRAVWVNIRPDQIIEKISKKDFFHNRRTFQDNSFQLAVTHGLIQESNEKAKESAKKNAMKNNNWIERY